MREFRSVETMTTPSVTILRERLTILPVTNQVEFRESDNEPFSFHPGFLFMQ
jgi:hypothetical protein